MLLILGLVGGMLLGGAVVSAAEVPQRIEYQGLLLDAAGVPLDGVVTLQIGIWEHPTSTNPAARVYLESHTSVPVVDGVFAVHIGGGALSSPAFDASLFDGEERWVEVTVNGETLAPRQPLGSTPYSLRCQRADLALDTTLLGGAPASAYQRRIDGTCPAGASISAIAADGSATCEPDDALAGDITGIVAGAGLAVQAGGAPGEFVLSVGSAAVTQAMIVDGAITAAHLAAGAVTTPAFQSGSVGAGQVADGSLTGADLQTGSVTGAKLVNASIGTAQIASASVGASQIAPNAATSLKIGDVVGFVDLADAAVTAAKLVDGSVRNRNLEFTITQYSVSAHSPTETSVTSATGHEYCVLTRVHFTAHDAGTNRYCAIDQTETTFILRARAGTGGNTLCEMACI